MKYKYLIFDLDETLYPRNAGLMQEIGRRISLYLTERMGYTPQEANRLRQHFYSHYGTTLRGLQTEYHVDADDYLRFVHDIPLENYIAPNPALEAMLGRIALKPVIFTNADLGHAQRVLARLGVASYFPIILDIRATDFYNKPDPQAYVLALRALRADGPECILVEDNARNLRPAKALGMTTVLVDNQPDACTDFAIDNLIELERVVDALTKGG